MAIAFAGLLAVVVVSEPIESHGIWGVDLVDDYGVNGHHEVCVCWEDYTVR